MRRLTILAGALSFNAFAGGVTLEMVSQDLTQLTSQVDAQGSITIPNLEVATNRLSQRANANEINIVAETNRATTAELVNSQAISSETSRATAAEALLRQETRQVGAMSMAASAAAGAGGGLVTKAKPTSVSVAVGYYQGYSALSAGVTHLVTDNVRFYGALTGTQDGKKGGAVGASFSF